MQLVGFIQTQPILTYLLATTIASYSKDVAQEIFSLSSLRQLQIPIFTFQHRHFSLGFSI
jgi:hypothetical protein